MLEVEAFLAQVVLVLVPEETQWQPEELDQFWEQEDRQLLWGALEPVLEEAVSLVLEVQELGKEEMQLLLAESEGC